MSKPVVPLSRYEQTVVRYAEWLVRWRWLVVALSLLAVVVMTAGVRHLQFDTDFRAYFGSENPQLKTFDEAQKVYNKADSIFFVFKPKSGDVFTPRLLTAVRDFTAEAWTLPYTMRVDSIANFQNTEAAGDDLKVGALVPPGVEITPAMSENARRVAISEPALVNRLVTPNGNMAGINVISQFPQATQDELPET